MTNLPLVSPVDRVLFLKAQNYLRGLSAEILSALALYTEERFYPAGSVIREADLPVDQIRFLGEGSVAVGSIGAESGAIKTVDAPGIVGLGHYFADVMKAPAVSAATDTLCLELDVRDLDAILEDHFSLLFHFARASAREAHRGLQALGSARPPEEGFTEIPIAAASGNFDLVERLAFARRTPFLRDMNLTVLGQLVREGTPIEIREGEPLWEAGDSVDAIALVVSGAFRLIGSDAEVLASAGSTLGGLEILSSEPRSEGWLATIASKVLLVRRDLFIDLLEDHYEFGLSYLCHTARKTVRVWQTEAGLEVA